MSDTTKLVLNCIGRTTGSVLVGVFIGRTAAYVAASEDKIINKILILGGGYTMAWLAGSAIGEVFNHLPPLNEEVTLALDDENDLEG